ncbi:4-hydroxythreonine-4-phosphate dehydrogenase PdxA [Sporomusa acidovorans]|uniref:D-threonate 4-phosphate dehydrogenase n=1 Tax=Sporomusa acidovorans (strain ATCC 49682 / DSM 3132 / Mol) TaxID=1123286 RepID=A0ABZ3IY75_SPOA4|nr:4-hydroxythreonine-4-phosphate dehydrogenase PdxA [Sporomusa acidovorans]OZC22360.1 4-hydroxythreonine-4-phosphate dehydrogenase 2 [Sporomusa acidovorans DSM 3132]SDE46730.1 4-hydroxythreonine-4-phosphate dehydrogenase [Sporomusa acidovorans]
MEQRPILAITMGDAAGCGPEVIVKALNDEKVYQLCCPLVFGDAARIKLAAGIVGSQLVIQRVVGAREGDYQYGKIDVLDFANIPADLPFGQVDARAGHAAYEYLAGAIEQAMQKTVAAVVTAPLNKEALHKGGHNFPGHTEILAQLSHTDDYAMMLAGDALRVIHVTTHVSMREAADLITRERVLKIISLADRTLRLLGIETPRIAVAGFNAHAGENGLFGREEIEEINPAIAAAKAQGIQVTGPVPPDTVFFRAARRKEFDIVVVMYHDQGHIPIKLLGFEDGINVTVGLPFLRTSVDHGTAFDIAGKGLADSGSMTAAIEFAAHVARGAHQ